MRNSDNNNNNRLARQQMCVIERETQRVKTQWASHISSSATHTGQELKEEKQTHAPASGSVSTRLSSIQFKHNTSRFSDSPCRYRSRWQKLPRHKSFHVSSSVGHLTYNTCIPRDSYSMPQCDATCNQLPQRGRCRLLSDISSSLSSCSKGLRSITLTLTPAFKSPPSEETSGTSSFTISDSE